MISLWGNKFCYIMKGRCVVSGLCILCRMFHVECSRNVRKLGMLASLADCLQPAMRVVALLLHRFADLVGLYLFQ